jgi:multidrug efflux system membrane fusion protein
MRKSVVIAVAIALVATVWVLSGILFGDGLESERAAAPGTDAGSPAASGDSSLPEVRVTALEAAPVHRAISVRGQTLANRIVALKGETKGKVVEKLVMRGDRVAEGEVLLRLEDEGRAAQLAEMKARVAQRRVELNAAQKLANQGYRAETSLAQARADYDAAVAAMEAIEVDIDNTVITAPFAGTVNEIPVEIGNFVDKGTHVATLVDLDPIKLVGYVTERDVSAVEPGADVTATLIDGTQVAGRVTFIAATAESQTRTFRVEATAPNSGEQMVRDGLTADLRIPLGTVVAHTFSPALLTLDDDGEVGVKIVDDEDIVHFVPVRIYSDRPDEVVVGGLPARVRIITVGQEFVIDGEKVKPVMVTAEVLR